MNTVKKGDVFSSSWGYDQTNVVFYVVVDLTPSGKSARLRKVAQDVVEEGEGWEMVAPLTDEFTGSPFTKRIGDAGGTPCCASARSSMRSYGTENRSTRQGHTQATKGDRHERHLSDGAPAPSRLLRDAPDASGARARDEHWPGRMAGGDGAAGRRGAVRW